MQKPKVLTDDSQIPADAMGVVGYGLPSREARRERRIIMLDQFIAFLDDNSLLHKSEIGLDATGFETRDRLQHLAFLAQNIFGLEFGYGFPQYMHGPYDVHLAMDYFHLATNKNDKTNDGLRFSRKDEFLNLVQNRDMSWLRLAVSMIRIYPTGPQPLIDVTEAVTEFPRDKIESVYGDIRNYLEP